MAERIDVVDIEFGNSQQEAEKLTKSLDELKQELYSLEKGSDAYNKKLQEVATETKRLSAINEELEKSTQSAGEKFESVLGAAAGFAGAIQIAEGTLQAFGIQSETAEEAIAKLQGVMAITDGLRTIKENAKAITDLGRMIKNTTAIQKLFTSTKKADVATTNAQTAAMTGYTTATTTATTATKALKTALITSGIGAILVGIGYAVSAIVENWDKWFSSASKTEDIVSGLKDINDEIDKIQVSSSKLLNINVEYTKGNITNSQKLLAELKEIRKAYNEAQKSAEEATKKFREGINSGALTDEEDIKAAEEEVKAIYQSVEDWKKKTEDKRNEYLLELAREQKEVADEYKKNAEEMIKIEKDKNNAIIAAYEDMNTRINTSIDNQWLERKTKLRDQYREDVKTARGYLRLKLKDAVEFNTAFAAEVNKLANSMNESLNKIDKEGKGIYDEILANISGGVSKDVLDVLNQYDNYIKTMNELKEATIITAEEYNIAVAAIEQWHNAAIKSIWDAEDLKKFGEKFNNEYSDIINEYNKTLSTAIKEDTVKEARVKMLNDTKSLLLEKAEILQNIGDNAGLAAIKQQISDIDNELSALGVTLYDTIDDIEELNSVSGQAFSELKEYGDDVSNAWVDVVSKISDSVNQMAIQFSTLKELIKNGEADWKDYGKVVASSLTSAFQIGAGMMSALAARQQQIIDDIDGNDAESMKRKAEAFEKQKKFEVAGATMSMLGGITAAIATAFQLGPIIGPIIGSINAAMVAATGGVQIAQIKKQKNPYGGGGSLGDGSDVATPALSAIQMMGQAVNPTTEIEGASVEGKVTDQRVYVTETDIRNTMNRVQVTEQEATF